MDSEYARRDARAVEDPITAIFDLAEAVDGQTPKIRRALRYVRVFVSVWLLFDFLFILIVSRTPALALLAFVPIIGFLWAVGRARQASTRLAFLIVALAFGAAQLLTFLDAFLVGFVLVSLFFLGFIILDLLRDLRSFFDYFALRHRVIQRVRQADPVVYVPEGRDSVHKILNHLAGTSPEIRGALSAPGGLVAPALLTGRSGLTYSFEAVVRSPASASWRYLGLGVPGFAVYVKSFERAPTLADLQALARAVADVSETSRIPPARTIALWRATGDESISPEAYEFLTKEAVRVAIRGSTFVCSLELTRESPDGTYDFIPVVMEPAPAKISPGASRALG